MRRATVAATGLFLMAFAPAAWALEKGVSMLAIELTHGTADVADKTQGGTGYISAYSHSELGIQAQYWRLMSEDYALTFTAGWGFFNETDEPGQAATPGSPDHKFSISSFNVRVGGDRVHQLGERTVVYGGPGIEFWSGNAKFEPASFAGQGSGPEYKGESTLRWGLSARIGATMMLSEYVGLTAHVGGRYGHASVEEDGAKASWWPSSVESSAGLLYQFGD